MDFYTHFNDAQRLAESIDDWEVDSFSWKKAYVAAVFAAIAYEEVPQFGPASIPHTPIHAAMSCFSTCSGVR